MNTKLRFALSLIIGVSLLGFVLYKMDFTGYINTLQSVNLWWFSGSLLIEVLLAIIIGYRLHYVFSRSGVNYPFSDSFYTILVSLLIDMVQTGIGTLSIIEIVHRKTGEPRGRLVSLYSMIYAMVAVVFSMSVGIGLYFFRESLTSLFADIKFNVFALYTVTPLIIIEAITLDIFLASSAFLFTIWGPIDVFNLPTTKWAMKLAFKLPYAQSSYERFMHIFPIEELRQFRKQGIVIFALTLSITALEALGWMLVLRSLNITITFPVAFGAFGLLSVAREVPFIPFNLGITDILIALGLTGVGISVTTGLAFVMLIRLSDVLVYAFGVTKIPFAMKGGVIDV